jgi:hypothetical protein
MKKTKNNVLPFPTPKEPTSQTIVCQIGRERFAIHFEMEDLSLAAPPHERATGGSKESIAARRGVSP